MDKLAQLWENKKVRTFSILGVLALLVTFIALSMTEDKSEKEYSKVHTPKREGSLLGVTDAANEISSREASNMIESLSRDMSNREKTLTDREAEMKKQNENLILQQQSLEAQILEMRQQMIAMAKMQGQPVNTDQGRSNQGGMNPTSGQSVQTQGYEGRTTTVQPSQVLVDANGNVVNTRQTQIITKSPNVGAGNVIRTVTQRNIREFRDGEVKERDVKISTINQRTQRPETPQNAGQAKAPLEESHADQADFALTMGSIITGTLLNGVAAPTSSDRESQPMPVLMRVKKEAVLPNYFTLDIRECHILASAVGDLSSSRAMLRAEKISCITNEGKSIERPIIAYAVSSSDGMAGIEGDVVFKSGALIANSLKAEFLKGFGEAFSPRQVQSLNTSPGASQLWQEQNLDKATGAGIGQGVSASASRISDYYLDMADQAHPVIELLPGIEVDFIVQSGMSLSLGSDYESQSISRNSATLSSPAGDISITNEHSTPVTDNRRRTMDSNRTNRGNY